MLYHIHCNIMFHCLLVCLFILFYFFLFCFNHFQSSNLFRHHEYLVLLGCQLLTIALSAYIILYWHPNKIEYSWRKEERKKEKNAKTNYCLENGFLKNWSYSAFVWMHGWLAGNLSINHHLMSLQVFVVT